MTLDELCREYTVHYYGGDERYRPAAYEVSVAHREGVAAILIALRNEISRSNDHDLDYSVSRYIDEILARNGEVQAAGASTRKDEVGARTPAPSPAAAPSVCEWTQGKDGWMVTACRTQYGLSPFYYKPKGCCEFCGKPVSFKSEAAR